MSNVPMPPVDHKLVKRIWWISPYQHAEAFCVMLYASKDRTVTEHLWNSRDGVTPFGITAQDGKTELFHDAWDYDVCVPKYRPAVGMRVFVDSTEDLLREAAVEYVEKYWEGDMAARIPIPSMKGMFESKEEAVQKMLEHWTEPGQPHVITVTQEWLDALKDEEPVTVIGLSPEEAKTPRGIH